MSTAGARRPQPEVIALESGGVLIVVPDGYVSQLAGWFQALEVSLAGQTAPGSVRQASVSPSLRSVTAALTAAAKKQISAQHQAKAFPGETGQIGSPANLPATCDPQEEITVAQAADLTGYTPQYIRRLASDHVIDGRQVDRDVWRLIRASVISFRESRKGADDSDDGQAGDRPRSAATGRTGGGDTAPREGVRA